MGRLISILLVPLFGAPFSIASRVDGWTSSISLHPKDSGVLLHLMTRLCSMIASWNRLIFRKWDGGYQINRLGWRGQKIPFPFSEFVVH